MTPSHTRVRALPLALLGALNAFVLMAGLATASSEVVLTVAVPKVEVPLHLQVSGGSVDSGPVEEAATGPVTTMVSFQWRVSGGIPFGARPLEIRHPEPVVVPAGTRLSLCLLAGVPPLLSKDSTCVSPPVRFRTTRAAVLDGEPCDDSLFIAIVYVSCGRHASVPAVPDGGIGLLPARPDTGVYVQYSRIFTLHYAGGAQLQAGLHATATLPRRATTTADSERTKAQVRAQALRQLASYGHAHLVRLEPSNLGDFVEQSGRTRYVRRTRAVFYTDEQLQDAARYAFQNYVNIHPGLGAPELDAIKVLSTSVVPDTTRIAMSVEIQAPRLYAYRVQQLANGCSPSACERRLRAAGVKVVGRHCSRPWLRHIDLAARVRVLVPDSESAFVPGLPRVP